MCVVCNRPGCDIGVYKRALFSLRNHNHTNKSASNMKTIFVTCAVLLVAVAQAYPLEAEQQLLQEAQLYPGEKQILFKFPCTLFCSKYFKD